MADPSAASEVNVVANSVSTSSDKLIATASTLLSPSPYDDSKTTASTILSSNSYENEDHATPELYALLLQTDGAPDHYLTFIQTKIDHVTLIFCLDLDHLCAILGSPHGSYTNIVERCMSIINFGLQNLALTRKPIT